MRRLFAPLLLSALALTAQGPVIDLSQTAVRPGPASVDATAASPASGDGHAEWLRARVEEVRSARAAGNEPRAAALVGEIESYLRQHNIGSADGLAYALVRESAKGGASAEWALTVAERISPRLPAIEMQRAEQAAARGYPALPVVFSHLSTAESKYFLHPTLAPARRADWLRPLSDLLLAIGLLYALVMFWRYNALWRHDIADLIAERLDWTDEAARFAAWAVVLAPLFLFISLPWLALFWISGLVVYFNWPERMAGLILLAATALWVPVQNFLFTRLAALQDPVHETAVLLGAGALDLPRVPALAQRAAAEPDNATVQSVNAGVLLRRGRYDDAIEAYNALIARRSDKAEWYNNRGVAYFYRFIDSGEASVADRDFARQNWETGLKYNYEARTVAALEYNLHLYYRAVNSTSEAQAHQDAALKGGNLSAHLRLQVALGKPIPVELYPESSETLKPALQAVRMPDGRPPSNPLNLKAQLANPLSIASILTLLFALYSGAARRKGAFGARAGFCRKCGDTFSGRNKDKSDYEAFCPACVAIYIKQEGVAPNVRLEKNFEVESHQRRRRIIKSVLAVLFPGFGHLYLGQALTALGLLLLGGALLVVGLGLRPGLSEFYAGFDLAPRLVKTGLLAVYGLFYLVSTGLKLARKD